MSTEQNKKRPIYRKLRGYAFDPSLSIQIDSFDFNEVTYKIPWEEVSVGPKGEYIEVIDYDPTIQRADGEFGVFYKGIDLNDAYVLASNGLTPSDSDPEFHQQMVYAVAMMTIKNFEKALGRKIIWRGKAFEKGARYTKKEIEDSYISHLRIYPHAFRDHNAYYSPGKRALLFGYFRSEPSEKQIHMPGSWVFTCLSHDIIAHEVTHAILDGLNLYYNEPTNPDVLAFHEAFADLVALFQHFTMPEVLKSQIAQTRGDLESQNLLGKLAQEVGSATGGYNSLRDAIGYIDKEDGQWKRKIPDPAEYETILEPHKRGSILVAAVFDAFLTIYKSRIADLLRIATGGTGILPQGELHPDLVNRLADEASKSASHVLNICIRAIDYCPPIDITFGEYLRAIITADHDLVSDDHRHYRIAFIDAFKRRGIYPKGLKSFSAESLKYPEVSDQSSKKLLATIGKFLLDYSQLMRFKSQRKDIAIETKRYIAGNGKQKGLHRRMFEQLSMNSSFENLTGIIGNSSFKKYGIDSTSYAKNKGVSAPSFWITNLEEISRVGPKGKKVNQIKFSLIQTAKLKYMGNDEFRPARAEDKKYILFRGGTNLIFDLDSGYLKYSIIKPIFDARNHRKLDEDRLMHQYNYQFDLGMAGMSAFEKYFDLQRHNELQEPFALLHNH